MLLRALVVAAALGALAPGCACGATAHPMDAGADAARDADRDAGPRDAGRDAGPRDAGPDAGPADAGPPDPAGWVPLPGLPDGCVIERAEHPEALFTAEWIPCGDGCLELAPPASGRRGFDPRVGHHDGSRGYFGIVQTDPVTFGRRVVLGTTEGAPLGAWRGPHWAEEGVCQIGPEAVASRAAAFGIRIYGDSWPRQSRIYHAPLADIGLVTEPVAILDDRILRGSNAVQHLAVSDTTVAAEVQPGGFIMVIEGGAMRKLGGGLDPVVRGIPQNVHIVGHQVLWEDWDARIRMAAGSMTADARYYYEAAGADVLSTATDGVALAWMQGYDYLAGTGWRRVELWTSGYHEDPALLAPRTVRDLDGYLGLTLGPGVCAMRRVTGGPQRAEIFDLPDGRRRTFTMPAGTALVEDPLYITATEMLLLVGRRSGATLWRVDITRLPYDGG